MDVKYGLPSVSTSPQAGTSERYWRMWWKRRLTAFLVLSTVSFFVGFHLGLPSSEGGRHATAPSHTGSASKPDFDWYAVSRFKYESINSWSRLSSLAHMELTTGSQLEPSTDINWSPCFDGHRCARLLLPLDYLEPEGPTTAIALRMIPAASRGTPAYRGTVLINPGGPGGSGTGLVGRAGTNISRIVGDAFDVLGFDPRGTGASTPSAICFDSEGQKAIWKTQGHRFVNVSDDTVGFHRAREQVVAGRCEQRIGGTEGIARFMSTASVATDMLRITEKMGQEKLHYWGFVSIVHRQPTATGD